MSCPQLHSYEATANNTTSSTKKDKTWLLDFASLHDIISDLANLSVHLEYDGTDKVILGDV